jgi:hypothetical protein
MTTKSPFRNLLKEAGSHEEFPSHETLPHFPTTVRERSNGPIHPSWDGAFEAALTALIDPSEGGELRDVAVVNRAAHLADLSIEERRRRGG